MQPVGSWGSGILWGLLCAWGAVCWHARYYYLVPPEWLARVWCKACARVLLLCVQVGQGRPHIFCDMRLVDDKGQELPRDGQAVGNLQVWCAVDAL